MPYAAALTALLLLALVLQDAFEVMLLPRAASAANTASPASISA
jgi:hypothetical protein